MSLVGCHHCGRLHHEHTSHYVGSKRLCGSCAVLKMGTGIGHHYR